MTERPLKEWLEELRRIYPPPEFHIEEWMLAPLRASGIAERALKAGDAMPDFILPNAEGAIVSSDALLADGPIILNFYRGAWCPFCSAELAALEAALPEIRNAGGRLVAITAEAFGIPAATKAERGITFDILLDIDHQLALGFGLLFRMAEPLQEAHKHAGVNFPDLYGDDAWFLPIPATYVVGRDGIIAYAYVNPDFRYRLDPEEILSKLKALQSK